MDFSKALIKWYLQNKRELPWRETTNPYRIWLSEIILQQTRVAQGLPYYHKFIESYPDVSSLANAKQQQILKLWQGLGYYSRARNLHDTAIYIEKNLSGIFPKKYNDLLKLKGVGEYTAAAIASFAFNEQVAVVDGNVFRVLARFFGIESDISENKTRKEFQKLANSLIPKGEAAVFNQAIMEFGALQCTPKNPDCDNCIFYKNCSALQKKNVDKLPIKSKKVKIKHRYFNFVIVNDKNNNILIEERLENDIWKNLFQFPLIEFDKKVSETIVLTAIQEKFGVDNIFIHNLEPLIHKLSHQHLFIRFFEINTNQEFKEAISLNQLIKKPFPIVLYNFIESKYFELHKK